MQWGRGNWLIYDGLASSEIRFFARRLFKIIIAIPTNKYPTTRLLKIISAKKPIVPAQSVVEELSANISMEYSIDIRPEKTIGALRPNFRKDAMDLFVLQNHMPIANNV